MNDLISRLSEMRSDYNCFDENEEPYYRALSEAIRLASAQPDIIRCKDCKHYQFADNRAFGMPVKMCNWSGFEDVDDDDFCSRAERRTDEGET